MARFKNTFTGRNIYLLISLIIFAGLITLGSLTLGPKLIDIARNPDSFRRLLGSAGLKSYLIFIAVQFVQIVFAFIPGEFIEVGAGYVYGGFKGTVLCLIGVALATVIIFSLTRLFGKKFTCIMIDSRDLKKLKFLQNEKKLEIMFILLYFIPGTPKDLITYFAGITRIKFGTFLLISTFCRLPSIVSSTYAGSALGDKQYVQSLIIFGVTAVIGAGGYLDYYLLSRRSQSNKQD